MPTHPNSLAALRPSLPGEVRNPLGINGVTSFRGQARRALEQMLAAEHAAGGATRLQVILEKLLRAAERGTPWAVLAILERIIPKVELHEHSLAESEPARLADALAAIAARLRARADPVELGRGGPALRPELDS